MSQVNKNELEEKANEKETVCTCNNCYCYKRDALVKPILGLSNVDLILCTNKDSDHYCHYVHPDHPMCDNMLQNELEEKENG
jgi:hypothetical protein